MLIAKEMELFNDEYDIYELKLDRLRCVAYLNETFLINKSNK